MSSTFVWCEVQGKFIPESGFESNNVATAIKPKRKSRFDVAPSENELSVSGEINLSRNSEPQFQATSTILSNTYGNHVNSISVIQNFSNMTNQKDTLPTNLATNPSLNLNNNLQIKTTSWGQSYVSATDAAFAKRLEDALQRNYNYIDKKDSLVESLDFPTPSYNYFNNKNYNNYNSLRKKAKSTLGLGSEASTVKEKYFNNNINCTVYISELPRNISKDEIDILFSPFGKIRRIKIYELNKTKTKADGIITYSSYESALLACSKLHNLNIGEEGKEEFIISVVMAEFGSTDKSQETVDSNNHGNNKKQKCKQSIEKSEINSEIRFQIASSLSSDMINKNYVENALKVLLESDEVVIIKFDDSHPYNLKLKEVLDVECEVDSEIRFPTLLLYNLYEIDYYSFERDSVSVGEINKDELMTDVLLECCLFGKVKSIALPSSDESQLRGSAIISFESQKDALNCAETLQNTFIKFHNKYITSKQIKCQIFLSESLDAVVNIDMNQSVINDEIDSSLILNDPKVIAEVEGLDEFFAGLL